MSVGFLGVVFGVFLSDFLEGTFLGVLAFFFGEIVSFSASFGGAFRRSFGLGAAFFIRSGVTSLVVGWFFFAFLF